MLEFAVLGSGSSGNAAVVRTEETSLLVDAGLSARQICRRMELLGVDADSLDGILITHEHGDHTRGIDVFCRSRQIPIYSTTMTREVLDDSLRGDVSWRHFESGEAFSVGELLIQSFPVPHDAVDPLGFVIRDKESVLGIVSDVGHVTGLVTTHLRIANTIFVEANYDEVLLQNDVKRPWPTKQRIISRHGHLSNAQTAELVAEAATTALCRVVLGHLSSDCNEPSIARGAVLQRLKEAGHQHVEVCCAAQETPVGWFAAATNGSAGTRMEPPEQGSPDESPASIEQRRFL